ncbi:acyltransferase family protein [Mycolicibacterium helvum]|uniref:Membrane protein n=1 Tax=Mycolicibacterium helvum TaxID=1534349 RepID=A0A7I7T6R3_9MYCO|nr:acyltransferase family protein [Mycolicibacterium helvum]BBY64952.1 membrane protein [Mycolicibacterium helvum]
MGVTARSFAQGPWVDPVSQPSPRRGPKPRGSGVPALNGIRGVAVALVLVGHGGIPGVAGGFIGVDIFFVLSGFLITALLLDEIGRTGQLDLGSFWVRRARRLLPALLIMVLAVIAARLLFPPDAVSDLRNDATAAFLWVANWAFVSHQTDYFSQGAPPSPLQHTWSLGVEEQYYLIWPVLIAAAAVLLAMIARRRGKTPTIVAVRRTVLVLAVLGTVGSAAEAILLASDDSLNRVYFGTDTRAQALLIGAAAAALLVRDWSAIMAGLPLIHSRWVRWLAWGVPVAGVAVLAAITHVATGSATEFRNGLFIVVAVAAVAVIAPVALEQNGPVAWVLSTPPLVALGVISYGVYLWHWPVFLVMTGERTDWTGYSLFAARCVVTLVLAVGSWWLIERPVRRWRPLHVPQLRLAAATMATAVAIAVVVVPVGTRIDPSSPDITQAALISPVETVRVAAPSHTGPREHTVSVFGDSIGWTMMRYLPPTPGVSFLDRTTIGCGLVRGGPYRYSGQSLEQKPECDAWPERWAQRIAYDRPDVVLMVVGRWETVDRKWNGNWAHIGQPDFDKYLQGELNHALDILSSTGALVVVTTEPYNRHGEQTNGNLYPEDQPSRVDQWNTLLRKVVGDRKNVTVLDLNKKLAPNGSYTNKINGVQVRIDGVHPTPNAVKWMTPWLLDAVR